MLSDFTAIQRRDSMRAEISSAVSKFLAAGGCIHRLSHTERAPDGPISYNHRPPRRDRREEQRIEQLVADHGRAYAAAGLGSLEATRRLRVKWLGRYVITQTRVEQLAALYGYAYRDNEGLEMISVGRLARKFQRPFSPCRATKY